MYLIHVYIRESALTRWRRKITANSLDLSLSKSHIFIIFILLPKTFAQLCLLRVEVTHRLHFTAFIRFEKLTLPHSLTGVFFFKPSVRVAFSLPVWLMSDVTKRSSPLLFPPSPPPTATSSDNQGPASPNLTARHFPYHSHSSESLDYLSGLMPKALSPTPYVPSGGHNTAGTASASMSGRVSPSVSPVTVSALSHYSSSSTTGLMDELQICSLDSPGCSPTPSPTLSYASVYTSNAGPDEALTPFVVSTASAATLTNVIIPPSQCCNTHPKQTNWFLLFFTSRNFGPILWTRPPFFTPSTNLPQ